MADPFSAFASAGLGNLIGGVESLIGGGATKGSSIVNASSSTTSEAFSSSEGENRDRLDISDEAIDKIVSDILSGPDGLADIFGGAQNAGIFNSSTANLAAGDLVGQITGEIAKLRAERVQTQNQEQTQKQTQDTTQQSKTDVKQKTEGLLDQLF